MDQGEVAARAGELPERFRDRLSPDDHATVEREIQAGEWSEGIDDLVAALRNANAPISPDEHEELTELMAGINMPTSGLNHLTIQ